MTRLQLRVLYRQFLFRFVDLEVLSEQAYGDVNKLLGQFAGLLVFISLVLSIPAIFGGAQPPVGGDAVALMSRIIMQHLLIATTMLAVGLFAVLSWDAAFPDARDVLVLGPLPVRMQTMFLAKVAAVATALGITILLLHTVTGLCWPLAFAAHASAAKLPAMSFDPTPVPVTVSDLQAVMDRDLRQALTTGSLAPGTGAGLAIGVWQRGERRLFTYGVAKQDSLFEIGSISKTFTGLILARMAAEGKVRFDEPVRELLPPGTVAKPEGPEITLLDLATHHSGLPRMPANFRPADRTNPYADYGPRQLYAFLRSHGVARSADTGFQYSNLGLGLLGQALAVRAGTTYPDLLREEVTGPLAMNDTVVKLSAEQQSRFLQGHDSQHHPVHAWDLDGLAGAGAIRSTAGDMVTYLAANLHPENHAALARAIASSQRLRDNAFGGQQVALAWTFNASAGTYEHGGATAGYSSQAFFHPQSDLAAVVLMNSGPGMLLSPGQIAAHIRQRLAGEPAVSLDTVVVPTASGLVGLLRSFIAYWFTMLAAALFVYCCVLSMQALAALALSRRLFLRVSGYLQMAAFCTIVCMYFLQPALGGLGDLEASSLWNVIQWLPSYGFLGIYQQLNGSMHPAMQPLANRAWIALALLLCATPVAYTLAYWRTMRRVVEEPDIMPNTRRLAWLPGFGSRVQTAIGQFSVRTLVRSRQHRMILGFYLGVGLAFTSLVLKDPSTRRQFEDGAGGNPWREASTALWMASVMMMILAAIGTRVVFALPLDRRANWIFRVTGVQSGREAMTASRRALLFLTLAPIWLAEMVVCVWIWPSWQTGVHLAALWLLGLTLASVCLFRVQKIPFACSYLPGKTRYHYVLLGAVCLVHGTIRGVLAERQALQNPGTIAAIFALLTAAWLSAHWFAMRWAAEEDPVFEDEFAPVVQELGLVRDGVMTIGLNKTGAP